MKICFRRRVHRSPRPRSPLQLHLPPPISDDPAFSTDPNSNPYHNLTGHEWPLFLVPGHPTLQGRRRRRRRQQQRLKAHSDDSQGDSGSEFELIQPPNSPAPSDNNNDIPQASPFPVVNRAYKDPPSAISSPTPMISSPAKNPKPPKRLGFLTKRKPIKHETDSVKPPIKSGRRSEEGPYSLFQFSSVSGLHRRKSAPDPRPSQVEREKDGVASNRAVPPIADINHDTASNLHHRPKQRLDLDSIDELDESNLFGPLHHDGPYEAVRAVVGLGSRMPLGLSDNGRLQQYHERTMKAVGHVYMPPEVPPGVSLNLSPGQVLPRNFRRQAGKPPRLRNNIVAPLPLEEVQNTLYEPTLAPRHANFNEIPFHKGARKPKQRPSHENPLDGPPIDASIAIGLAMMRFVSAMDEDDDLPATPNPISRVQQQSEELDYDPYAPENIEHQVVKERPSPSEEKSHSSPSPLVDDLEGRVDESELTIPSGFKVEEPPTDDFVPYSRSPSPTSRLNFSAQGIHNGASEETLVQRDEERDRPEGVLPTFDHNTTANELETILKVKIEQSALPSPIPSQHHDQDFTDRGSLNLATPPTHVLASQPEEVSQDIGSSSISPTPLAAGRFDKQLPRPPANSPPLPNPFDIPHIANDLSQPPEHPVRETEWKNSALHKAMQRSDTRTTNRSSASYQSHSSTKGDDGHTPATNMSGRASSNHLAPQMMSQQQALDQASPSPPTPLISRRDPIFNTDSLTRYPVPKQLPSSTPPTQDRSRTVLAQRANSVSSSKRSFQLSPIQEDTPLPQFLSDREKKGQPTDSNQFHISNPDTRPPQGLQRSQSSVQPERFQIGQVYPRHLQGPPPPLQRSTTQLVPQGRPPAYSERTIPNPPPSRQQYDQFIQQQQQQQLRKQVQTRVELELEMQRRNGSGGLQIPARKERPVILSPEVIITPDSRSQTLNSTARAYPDDRRAQRAVNTLSGVPETDENPGSLQHYQSLQSREQYRPRDPQAQQYPIRDNASVAQSSYSSSSGRLPPRRLPTHLVMPAPLQNTNPKPIPQTQHFIDIFGPRPSPSDNPPRVSKSRQRSDVPREPSPPNILPPLLSSQDTRFDPAISAGRKLRKRSSHVPPPSRMDISPNIALDFKDFKPVIISTSLSEKPAARPISEKPAKRVLSKKRTNF